MNLFRLKQALGSQLYRNPYLVVLLVVILFSAVYVPLARQALIINKQLPTIAAAAPVKAVSAATAPPASSDPAAATTKAITATSTSTAQTPQCAASTFGTPSALIANSSSAVTVQNDTPSYYQIYGNTAAQLVSQIQHCAPGGNNSSGAEFTGQTAYNITWQYDYTNTGSSCTIGAVRVGLHTAIALPYWAATSSATSGLTGRWQSFASGLATHEQGHIALDNQYAAVIANDLQSIGTISCNDVASTVASVSSHDLSVLNQANDAYDAATNHGATQGAVLPTL